MPPFSLINLLLWSFIFFWTCFVCPLFKHFQTFWLLTRHGNYHSVVKAIKDHKVCTMILNVRHAHLVTWIWLAFGAVIVCGYTTKMCAFWGLMSYGSNYLCMYVSVAQSCPTLCNPMDCSPPGPFVHGILQARILEWVAILFSRGSSWPGDRNQVSCTAGRFFTVWATREAPWFWLPHHKCSKYLKWSRKQYR